MKLVFDRIESRCSRGRVTVDVDAPPTASQRVGRCATTATRSRSVDSVAVVWRVVDADEPVRMFRHGYQSWSPSGWATFGVDEDPSRTSGAIPLVVDMHHADPQTAEPGELRSEFVTVLDDGRTTRRSCSGSSAAPTRRHLSAARRDRGSELWAEAYLGGDVVEPASRRAPLGRVVAGRRRRPPLLDEWAAADRVVERCARRRAPYQVGWCSWYHYFHDVTEPTCGQPRAGRRRGRSTCSSSTTASSRRSATGSTTNDKFAVGARRLAAAHRARPGSARALDRPVPRRTESDGRAPTSRLARPPRVERRPLVGMFNDALGRRGATCSTPRSRR